MTDIIIGEKELGFLKSGDVSKWNEFMKHSSGGTLTIKNAHISNLKSLTRGELNLDNVTFENCTFEKNAVNTDLSHTKFKGCTFKENLFVCMDFTKVAFEDSTTEKGVTNRKTYFSNNEFINCMTNDIDASDETKKKFAADVKKSRLPDETKDKVTACTNGEIKDKEIEKALKELHIEPDKQTALGKFLAKIPLYNGEKGIFNPNCITSCSRNH